MFCLGFPGNVTQVFQRCVRSDAGVFKGCFRCGTGVLYKCQGDVT